MPLATPPAEGAPAEAPPTEQANRPADVSPLAAVIGIALLGGMLLIGVLIGRGDTSDESPPAATIQVGEGTGSTTTASTTDSGGGAAATPSAVTSEWPAGTDGFTIQITTLTKSDATPESVDSAKQSALDDGAPGAAVLDSDLYSSLPPDEYVIYSGVYASEKEAQAALKDISDDFPDATVVEVAGSTGATSEDEATPEDLRPDGRAGLQHPGPHGAVAERGRHGARRMSAKVIERLKPVLQAAAAPAPAGPGRRDPAGVRARDPRRPRHCPGDPGRDAHRHRRHPGGDARRRSPGAGSGPGACAAPAKKPRRGLRRRQKRQRQPRPLRPRRPPQRPRRWSRRPRRLPPARRPRPTTRCWSGAASSSRGSTRSSSPISAGSSTRWRSATSSASTWSPGKLRSFRLWMWS